MKTRLGFLTAIAFSGTLLLNLATPPGALAQGALRRLSSEMINVTTTNSESSTDVPARSGGTVIYSKTLMVPGGNTLFVTFHGTGDQHAGVGLELLCQVDGTNCNPGSGDVGRSDSAPGWVTLGKHFNYDTTYFLPDGSSASGGDGSGGNGDQHDNTISYSWCFPDISSGPHTVTISLGNSCGDAPTPSCAGAPIDPIVYVEASHIDIDVGQLPKGSACAPLS
jgi:hypothetical protein